MKIEYIREFLVLAEHRNFTLAARKLFLAQSVLSRHISALEKDIGAELFSRNTHAVRLTEFGEKAYRVFQKMTVAYDSLVKEAGEYRSGLFGTLKIGMLYYSIKRDFGDLLPRFQAEYPNISVATSPYQPHTMYEALLDGKIDIGVLWVADYPGSEHIDFNIIATSNAYALLSTKHRLAGNSSLCMDDLADETIILLEEDTIFTRAVTEALDRSGFTPVRTVFSSNIDTVPFTVKETNGVHIIGGKVVFPQFDDLLAIPIKDKTMLMKRSLAFRRDNLNPAIPHFIKTACSGSVSYG